MRRILLATLLVSCAAQQQWVVPRSAPAAAAPLASAATTAATTSAGPSPALRQARVDAARKGYELVATQWSSQGAGTREELYVWSRRLFEAQRDAGVATAGADHLARMKKLRDLALQSFQGGGAGSREVASAEYFVAEAAVWQ